MNDPHVEKLYYSVIFSSGVDFNKAPPISGERDNFKWNLSKNQLIVKMKAHCATEIEARGMVDDFLKEWELSIGLTHGPESITFRYRNAEVTDRKPDLNNTGAIGLKVVATNHVTVTSLDAVIYLSHHNFPAPPQNFKISPEVDKMYMRYKRYCQGKESLLVMAYWCYTVIVDYFKGQSNAAKKLQISNKVLTKLSILSNKGDPKEARKMKGEAGSTPLSSIENKWLNTVVNVIIRRTCEYAFDPNAKLPQITMSDFPTIS